MVKLFQFIGLVMPFAIVAFGWHLFSQPPPDTPNYAGAANLMLLFGVVLFASMIEVIFVLPTIFILSKKPDRIYFKLDTGIWLWVFRGNQVLLAIYVMLLILMVVMFALSPPR